MFCSGGAFVAGQNKSVEACEDFAKVTTIENKGVILALSDGAGSAACAQQGAVITVNAFSAYLYQFILNDESFDLRRDIFPGVRKLLLAYATKNKINPKALLATIEGAILLKDKAFFFSIGDGMSVYLDEKNEMKEPFLKEETEFVNETDFFLDEGALLYEKWVTPCPNFVAILSDGLKPLCYSNQKKEPFEGFFMPLYDFLAEKPPPEEISMELEKFLRSGRVRQKVNDDLSLLIARKF